jgi:DNA-directed RNA polymerase subunit RPC12/RpoP
MAHYECRYCDCAMPPRIREYEGDRVCRSCGAEWEAAKVLVEDKKPRCTDCGKRRDFCSECAEQ